MREPAGQQWQILMRQLLPKTCPYTGVDYFMEVSWR